MSGNHISFSDRLQVPLSYITYSDLNNSPRLSIYWSILNSHTDFNLFRIRFRCLMNLAHSCVPPLEYTPVSRIPIFSLTGEYTTADIGQGLNARAVRAQVDTSVYAERWRLRLFGVSPLEDLLITTAATINFIVSSACWGRAYISKLLQKALSGD